MLAGAGKIHPRTRRLATINTMTKLTEPLHQYQEKALLLNTVSSSPEVTTNKAHRPEPDETS